MNAFVSNSEAGWKSTSPATGGMTVNYTTPIRKRSLNAVGLGIVNSLTAAGCVFIGPKNMVDVGRLSFSKSSTRKNSNA